jgi:hypothetical protein
LNDLRPYRPTAPLTGGARFIRGFTRIGIACGDASGADRQCN